MQDVMFKPANLNQLGEELTTVANTVRGASDFVMTMDPDEFLTLQTNNSSCTSGSFLMKDVDCTLSPYALQEYLSDASNLASIADGHKLRIGFIVGSRPDKELCDAGKGDEIGLMQLGPANAATDYKAILDSRSFRAVDLGGHSGKYFPPHNMSPDKYTPLSIIYTFILGAWNTSKHPKGGDESSNHIRELERRRGANKAQDVCGERCV
jgi:hypothetical protein